jgi:hypothetical protein
MTPATNWQKLNMAAGTGWTPGFPDPTYDSSSDYYEDFLFEGAAFAIAPTTHTELTLAGGATATTELILSGGPTPYTELTL